MSTRPIPFGASVASMLIALLLTGSTGKPAATPSTDLHSTAADEVRRLNLRGKQLFRLASYGEAHDVFLSAAVLAEKANIPHDAAANWNNAGYCSEHRLQFRTALDELLKAQRIAEASREYGPLLFSLDNLASLYIQMGQPQNAARIARDALDGPAGHADPRARAGLICQIAAAYVDLNRFDDAVPYFREGIAGLMDAGDLDTASRVWSGFGNASLNAGRTEMAEWALSEALRLVRVHELPPLASVLCGLAKVKARKGEFRSAAALFDAALSTPPNPTPLWKVYSDRGQFRLERGDLAGALADFREARRVVDRMRTDMVPADQDRVALESGLALVFQGLVAAGNRLARATQDAALIRETFDTAEQGRLWSLRALVPEPDDWRSRLPARYWDLLAQYQSLERTTVSNRAPDADRKAANLGFELRQMEANAAGTASTGSRNRGSALAHVQDALGEDRALFSFHISKTSSWIWAIDRRHAAVFPLPPAEEIERAAKQFTDAVRTGLSPSQPGHSLYRDLFGSVPAEFLRRRHWLLELDGPLYEVPFAALVVEESGEKPVYLVERTTLESIPGALLLEDTATPIRGPFVGVGDPVYNMADTRYRGKRGRSDLTLPRLPNTAGELSVCRRAWGSPESTVLTGPDASLEKVRRVVSATRPAIIHFATHVVKDSADSDSGMIALSLDSTGAMGLLGPREIIATRVDPRLVIMDGCHSAEGRALPAAGLMGLTRAWIGAGAHAVMATGWDVPDDAAEGLMVEFYRALRADPGAGPAAALRAAQLSAIGSRSTTNPAYWAGYFLLSRIP
ncbi:MAG TPA: CHAT domain-containing protein [Bryobacteraceae bacterium]|nr:CHAT domain-containing protein [Bryobacteraceae bacterium]